MVQDWNVGSETQPLQLKGHSGPVDCVAYSPDGTRIVSGAYDSTVRVWDAASGVEQLCLRGHTAAVYSVAFSPDGCEIVSGAADSTVRVWNVRSEQPLCLRGDADPISCVAVSPPDGRYVASGGYEADWRPGTERFWHGYDCPVIIWDTTSGLPLLRLYDHKNPLLCVTYSEDGRRVKSWDIEGAIVYWDAEDGTLLKKIERGESDIPSSQPVQNNRDVALASIQE